MKKTARIEGNAQPKELFYEEDETRIGPPSKSDLPPPRSGQRARQLYFDEDVTQIGPPSKSNRPPPMSSQRAPMTSLRSSPLPSFNENEITQTGLPSKSNLPPPKVAPQDAVDRYDDVTKIQRR